MLLVKSSWSQEPHQWPRNPHWPRKEKSRNNLLLMICGVTQRCVEAAVRLWETQVILHSGPSLVTSSTLRHQHSPLQHYLSSLLSFTFSSYSSQIINCTQKSSVLVKYMDWKVKHNFHKFPSLSQLAGSLLRPQQPVKLSSLSSGERKYQVVCLTVRNI